MKTFHLLLSLCWVQCCVSLPFGWADPAAGALTEAERVATAEALVDAVAREDFAAATARFCPALRRALPEARLRVLWASMIRQAGAFRARGTSRTESSGATEIVYVTAEFREFVLEAKVEFNAVGEVTAFHFFPPPH